MMFARAMIAISTPASLIRLRARLRFTVSAIQSISSGRAEARPHLLIEKSLQERPVDGDDQNESDEQRGEAEPPRKRHLLLGRRTGEQAGQRALTHHTVILLGPLFAQTVEPHLAREHHLVHREALRTQ